LRIVEDVLEIISSLPLVIYFAAMESSQLQATVGKLILGLKVTDLSGNRISFSRALGRELAKLVPAFILCIGFIVTAFTSRKQAFHDFWARTLVVSARKSWAQGLCSCPFLAPARPGRNQIVLLLDAKRISRRCIPAPAS
jgi:uncharacterized RDD family membrane protein YckC